MSSQEVTVLRKQGKLKEALVLAMENLTKDPENIWNKRAISWVYYSLLKQAQEHNDVMGFRKYLLLIKELQLPDTENMVFDSVAWAIGKYLFANSELKEEELNSLFALINDMSFTKPKESFSFLMKALSKHFLNWNKSIDVVKHFGLEFFMPVDYNNYITDSGRKLPSTVESIYISIAKKVLANPEVKSDIEWFEPYIKKVSHDYKNMQYPPYYYAKILLVLGDKDKFITAFLPFARKKKNDFWVWDLMSEAFPKESQEYLACLCRSLSCGAPEKFLGNVREKLATTLIAQQRYSEAKFELEKIIATRLKERWPITDKQSGWKNKKWWQETVSTSNDIKYYKKHTPLADSLLFADTEQELIAVEYVNGKKTVLQFMSSKEKYGLIFYGKLKIKPQAGEVYSVRFTNNNDPKKSSFYQVQSMVFSQQNVSENIMKSIEGVLTIKEGNSFGFLKSTFVSPTLIQQHNLKNNDKLMAKAILSYNKKHKNWGWKVITIEKK